MNSEDLHYFSIVPETQNIWDEENEGDGALPFSYSNPPSEWTMSHPIKMDESQANGTSQPIGGAEQAMNIWVQHRDAYLKLFKKHLRKKVLSESTDVEDFWWTFSLDLFKHCCVESTLENHWATIDYARFLVYLNMDFQSNREEATTYSPEFKRKLSLMLNTHLLDFSQPPPQSYASTSVLGHALESHVLEECRSQLRDTFVFFIQKKRLNIRQIPQLEAVLTETDIIMQKFLGLSKKFQWSQIECILSK